VHGETTTTKDNAKSGAPLRELLVIRPRGSLTGISAAERLRQSLARTFETGNVAVVLDLSEITHLDNAGLRAIAWTFEQARGNGDLVVCGARDTVASLFRLTRLDRRVRMFATAEEACKAIAS